MSKPHLAIQNQAVKYAQKDMNGNDINIKELEGKIPTKTTCLYIIEFTFTWNTNKAGYAKLLYLEPEGLTMDALLSGRYPLSISGNMEDPNNDILGIFYVKPSYSDDTLSNLNVQYGDINDNSVQTATAYPYPSEPSDNWYFNTPAMTILKVFNK